MTRSRERPAVPRRVVPAAFLRAVVAVSVLAGTASSPAAGGEPPAPEPAAPPAPEPAPEPTPEPLGRAAAFGAEEPAPRLALPAGTVLRERPDPRAAALDTLEAPADLPVLERRGAWARVARGALRGWVPAPGADPESPAGGTGAALPARGADPELLERALARLDGPEDGVAGTSSDRARRLGAYALYTDVEDEALLESLSRVAGELHRVYRERYGLDPEPDGGPGEAEAPREAVVLFARQEDYLAFAETDAALAGLEAGGFAGFGLAALSTGGRTRAETATLLVHELVHLANARTLGPRTPPWLEEGLANDLSFSRIDSSGRLDPETLGGTTSVRARWPGGVGEGARGRGGVEVTVTSAGGRAALERLAGALERRELLPLEELAHLSWRRLVDPERRRLGYAQSAFFVRFLLDPAGSATRPADTGGHPKRRSAGEPPPEAPAASRSAAFRSYLQDLAAGRAAGPDALPRALGTDWATLDREFRRWLGQRTAVR